MKWLAIFVFLLNGTLFSQQLIIVHIEGNILNGKTSLRLGDTISTDATITFSSEKNKLVVLHEKNIFQFSIPGTLQATFKSNGSIIPSPSSNLTRSSDNQIVSIKDYFGDSTFLFLKNHFKLKIAPVDSISENQFYIFRFKYKDRIFSERISENSTVLNIDKSAIYTTKKFGELPADSITKAEIFKYNIEKRSFTKICSFQPNWKREEVKSEIKILKKQLKVKNCADSEIEAICMLFVKSIYGKTDEFFLSQLIKTQ